MHIHFERSGGFAGLRLATTIDSGELPPEEVQALQDAIERAHFFDLPEQLESSSPGADRFHYRLTVDWQDQHHTVEADEAALPDELRPLVNRLSLLARNRR